MTPAQKRRDLVRSRRSGPFCLGVLHHPDDLGVRCPRPRWSPLKRSAFAVVVAAVTVEPGSMVTAGSPRWTWRDRRWRCRRRRSTQGTRSPADGTASSGRSHSGGISRFFRPGHRAVSASSVSFLCLGGTALLRAPGISPKTIVTTTAADSKTAVT